MKHRSLCAPRRVPSSPFLPFQCSRWHAGLQYFTLLHREQRMKPVPSLRQLEHFESCAVGLGSPSAAAGLGWPSVAADIALCFCCCYCLN